MALQLCNKCKLTKPRGEFKQYRTNESGKPCYRKTCQACRNKDNKKSRLASNHNKKLRDKKRIFKEHLVALRGGKCERCNISYPSYCYDFHHISEDTKLYTIANLMAFSVSDSIKTKVYEELEKCVMLCANCHRITHRESQDSEDVI
jgi:hypothetical protein